MVASLHSAMRVRASWASRVPISAKAQVHFRASAFECKQDVTPQSCQHRFAFLHFVRTKGACQRRAQVIPGSSHVELSTCLLLKDQPFHIGPELRKGITGHFSRNAQYAAPGGIVRPTCASDTPCV